MSKKYKSQASSARAASSPFGGASTWSGGQSSSFQSTPLLLSYVTELPDLSAISDPTVVVAFKNLTKKDSVTKTKALEDLQDFLSSNVETGPETAILDAWVGAIKRIRE